MIGEFNKVIVECLIRVDDVESNSRFIACTDGQLQAIRETVNALNPTNLRFTPIKECECGKEVECCRFLQTCECGLQYDRFGKLYKA